MISILQKLIVASQLSCVLVACNILDSVATASPQKSSVTATFDEQNRVGGIHEGANVLEEMSATILGPVWDDWPRGHDWARDKPDQPRTQILTVEPHELVIHLPSGRAIRHNSKATFFNQRRGIITGVSLMPHLGGPLGYQEAISLLETILEQWDAEFLEHTKVDMAKWKAEGDLKPWVLAKRQGSASLRNENRAGIYFEIRPTAAGEGWFLAVDVAVGWDEVRRILDTPEVNAE